MVGSLMLHLLTSAVAEAHGASMSAVEVRIDASGRLLLPEDLQH